MTTENQEMIDTTEAAKILGVNQSRVRQLIRSGALSAEEKFARGQPYYELRRSDVEAFAKIPRKRGPKARVEQC